MAGMIVNQRSYYRGKEEVSVLLKCQHDEGDIAIFLPCLFYSSIYIYIYVLYIQPPDPVSGRFFRQHLSIALQLSIPRLGRGLIYPLESETKHRLRLVRSFKIFISWRFFTIVVTISRGYKLIDKNIVVMYTATISNSCVILFLEREQ